MQTTPFAFRPTEYDIELQRDSAQGRENELALDRSSSEK